MVVHLALPFLLLAVSVPAWSEEPKPPPELPRSMERATDTLHKDIDKAKADYAKAMISAVEKYQKTLEVEMQKATRAGNLDLALVIKGQLEGAALLLEGVPVPPGDEAVKEPEKIPEYAQIRGKEYTISSRSGKTALFATKAGKKFVVVLNPEDKWAMAPTRAPVDPCQGDVTAHPVGGHIRGIMFIQIGDGAPEALLPGKEYDGEGTIFLFCNDDALDNNSGNIRAKVVAR